MGYILVNQDNSLNVCKDVVKIKNNGSLIYSIHLCGGKKNGNFTIPHCKGLKYESLKIEAMCGGGEGGGAKDQGLKKNSYFLPSYF